MRVLPIVCLAFVSSVSALTPVSAQQSADDGEREVVRRVIVQADGDHQIDVEADLECVEENGKKVCIGTSMHDGHGGTRGYLGVHLTPMTPDLRQHMGAPADSGVLVSKVETGSPAEVAGIEVGDVLTAVDGDSVASAHELRRTIGARGDGDLATIELYRDGRLEQLTATLGAQEGHATHVFRLGDGNFDLHEILGQVHSSLGDLDVDLSGLHEHLGEALGDIDFSEISVRVHEAMKGLHEELESAAESTP
jgi:membrane-associated protease RseP (regulator of RpoE activity)